MKKLFTNNIGLKIGSILVAALLWFVVVNVDNPVGTRTFRDVQVKVLNTNLITDDGKTYQILDRTDVVSVTVTAKRSILDKLSKTDIEAYADMKDYDSDLNSVKIRAIVRNYDSATCITNPVNMRVRIEDLESKQLPITVETKGTPADGYKVGQTTVDPESVTISGPKSMVNKVAKAVVTVDVNGLTGDKTLPATLVLYDNSNRKMDSSLIQDNPDKDRVSVHVSMLNSKKVSLNIEGVSGNPAEGYEKTDVTIEPAAITIAGRQEDLNKINSIPIPSSAVNISGAKEKVEKVIDITDYLPDHVVLADDKDANILVTVAIEKTGTKTIEIPILSLKVTNAPTGLELSYASNDDLKITCQGLQEDLAVLTADDVKASMDLKNYKKAGKYKVHVSITLPEGVTISKAVTVEIELKEKEEASPEITDEQDGGTGNNEDEE